MQASDPRVAESAADLSLRYGADALVIARGLASGIPDPQHKAFWHDVAALLGDRDSEGTGMFEGCRTVN